MALRAPELIDNIQELNELIWERQVTEPMIEDWVSNFKSERARFPDYEVNALYLLSNFLYFGSKEIRSLLKSMYRDKVKYRIVANIRRSLNHTLDANTIHEHYERELRRSRFIPVGNPSESGSHLLYFFRQENQLGKDLFVNAHQIFEGNHLRMDFRGGRFLRSLFRALFGTRLRLRYPLVKRYIFIDDFCGFGSQGLEYSRSIVERIKGFDEDVETSYLVLVATSDGIDTIVRNTLFDHVDAVFELDRTFKCFGANSRYFSEDMADMKKATRDMCRLFGERLVQPAHALGFDDCQLLLGFHHNVPDNTLPVIWFDEPTEPPWIPICKRYPKLYGGV
ncbi:MAG TPA: hypothetical protein VMY05_11495 [Acidobacteriota bacterium]|nr:hypothetical protein [Acidobacteriota bacterium]